MFDLDFQSKFIGSLQIAASDATLSDVESELTPASKHRLFVYRKSFVGRVVGVLTETVLAPVTTVFGKDVVHDVLIRYFGTTPPHSARLVDSINDLHRFVLDSSEHQFNHLFASLVDLSIKSWQLLAGEDPAENMDMHVGPSSGKLKTTHFALYPHSGIDMHGAWSFGASDKSRDINELIHGLETGILLVKTSESELNAIRIDQGNLPFIRKLCDGKTAHGALREMSDLEISILERNGLADLLSHLTRSHCFLNGRGTLDNS